MNDATQNQTALCPRCLTNPKPKRGEICTNCMAEEMAAGANDPPKAPAVIGATRGDDQGNIQHRSSAPAPAAQAKPPAPAAARQTATQGTAKGPGISKGRKDAPMKVVIYGPHGVGKAQPLDASVLTPEGFLSMGDIRTGMKVIGGDGKPKTVKGVFPQGTKPIYRVTMTDGAETECCADHLWTTSTARDSTRAIRPLREIQETLYYDRGNPDNERTPADYPNHRIPIVGPVEFAQGPSLPLSPYLLGLLLGDGGLTGTSIMLHKPEQDVLAAAARHLPVGDVGVIGEDNMRIRRESLTGPMVRSATSTAIAELGLAGHLSVEKFVPWSYLMASVDARTALLRGLCDTDGHVIRSGARVEISTSSPRLMEGIRFLIWSLGGTVTVQTRTPGYSYRGEKRTGQESYRMLMFFPNGLCPVSSKKHLAKWKGPRSPYYRGIASVEEAGEKECQCISVDAEDGLYVTDDFIVTHNTSWGAAAPSPIIIPAEVGSEGFDVDRFDEPHPPRTFEEVVDDVRWLVNEPHDYKTVVLDTADAIEQLAYQLAIRKFNRGGGGRGGQQADNIEEVGGGYKKGYIAAGQEWIRLLAELERLRNMRGMHIVITAHAKIVKFANPKGEDFDRYTLKLHQDAGLGLVQEWAEAVLFATYRITTTKAHKRAKAKGEGGRERVMYTQNDAAWDAKNRYDLPAVLPLEWGAFYDAVQANKNVELTRAAIDKAVEALGADVVEARGQAPITIGDWVAAALAKNPDSRRLAQIRNKLEARLEQLEDERAEQEEAALDAGDVRA